MVQRTKRRTASQVVLFLCLFSNVYYINKYLLLKKFVSWVKPALSGEDGNLSIRRFLAFVIGWIYGFGVVHLIMNSDSTMYSFFTIAVSAVVFMLLLQIIYPKHLIDAIKAYNKKEDENN